MHVSAVMKYFTSFDSKGLSSVLDVNVFFPLSYAMHNNVNFFLFVLLSRLFPLNTEMVLVHKRLLSLQYHPWFSET